MYALSVLEPWASGIVHGTKRIENRVWRTNYRGPLLIHAGKGRQLLRGVNAGHEMLQRLLPGLESLEDLRHGHLIGVVDVVDCVRVEDLAPTLWAEGPFCWVLANPRPLPELIPWKGQQQLFNVPDHVLPAGFAG
jgi:hypothetical protein